LKTRGIWHGRTSTGKSDPSIGLDNYLEAGSVPPGAFVHPRYKVASMSYTMRDVELKCLNKETHCGSSCQVSSNDHGCWAKEEGETVFYPKGFALLGWNTSNR
jgi:hypothetical protein